MNKTDTSLFTRNINTADGILILYEIISIALIVF